MSDFVVSLMPDAPLLTAVDCEVRMAASVVVFGSIYFASFPVSKALSKTFRGLSDHQKVDWCSRVSSTIHAVVVTVVALFCLYDEWEIPNRFQHDSPAMYSMLAMSAGYLITDALVICFNFDAFGNAKLNMQTLLHHALGISGLFLVLKNNVFLFYMTWRIICEGSTPFVNLRWFLATNEEWKNSKLYVVNGLLMVFSFFALRVAMSPFIWIAMFKTSDQLFQANGVLVGIFIAYSIVLDVLNLYWFSSIWKGLLKALRGDAPKKTN
eukprot:Opistho-2@20774